LGMPEVFRDAVQKAAANQVEISFNQGLDIRLLTDELAGLLATMPTYEDLHFGFDSYGYHEAFSKGCKLLRKHHIIGRSVFLFLVGFDTSVAEEIQRLKVAIAEKAGVYFMFYNRGKDIRGPFGDVDVLFGESTDGVIRAPVGNLRLYRKLVAAALERHDAV